MLVRPRWWSTKGPIAYLLLSISALYWLATLTHRALYRFHVLQRWQSPVPLIVVGNLVVGGAGKTPSVIAIAHYLRQQGWTPGVVSRGWGRGRREDHLVENVAQSGDEPALIHGKGFPCAVANRRPNAVLMLLEKHPSINVVISDDGLQHFEMKGHLEIVVEDPNQVDNGMLLPAGPWRESCLRVRDASIVRGLPFEQTKNLRFAAQDQLGEVENRFCDKPKLLRFPEFFHLYGRHVHALAAIGAPQRFFQQLEDLGLNVEGHPLPDHHPNPSQAIEQLPGDRPILITEKDAIKCGGLFNPRVWVVRHHLEIDHKFFHWLEQHIEKQTPS